VIAECLVVEFRVSGDGCPLAAASEAAGVAVDAAPPLRRSDGFSLLRFSAPGTGVGDYLDADDRVRYLHRAATEDRYTHRCLSRELCVVHELIDVGFLAETIRYEAGSERYLGAVVGQDVLGGVLEAAGRTVGVTLERVSPLGEEADAAIETRWDLTPKQAAALRVAHELGYFEVPRACTAGEVADELGISKTAFLERLRRAQGALVGQAFR